MTSELEQLGINVIRGLSMDAPLAENSGHQGTAMALAPDGSLYAGGDFHEAGGVTVNHVARWDGSQWHALDTGTVGDVYALAVDAAGNLYAGGELVS